MKLSGGLSAAKVAVGLAALTLLLSSPATANVLTEKAIYTSGEDGVTGLTAVRMVVVSPDGKNVYTAAEGDNAITVWSRAADGSLTEIQVLQDGVDGVTGLSFVDNLSVSPDGHQVYAAGIKTESVSVFSRDSSGKLTLLQQLVDGVDVPSGLNGVVFNTVSPDGLNVYTAATLDGAVVVFARNKRTGKLNPIQVLQEGVDGVTGLGGVFPITVSYDGKNVYVGGRTDHTVLVYQRLKGGTLKLIQTLTEGVDGIRGIDGARYITEAYEQNVVYVAGLVHNTVVVLQRDPATGMLTDEIQVLIHKVNAGGLASPSALVESYNHQHLFAAGFGSFAVDSFRRNSRTGLITSQEQEIQDPGDDSLGLIEVTSLAMSPGGANLYAVATFSDTLVVFDIAENSHETHPVVPATGSDD
jgi:6-phosphogluconolactonase (cycloisomerase 2 family)